jgi:hypothetical protein
MLPAFKLPVREDPAKEGVARGTGALEDRTMTSTLAEPIRRAHAPVAAPVLEGSRDVRHDPAGFGAALREIAVRAHRAVRALDAMATAEDSLRELADLHLRIVQLQRCLDAGTQQGLASYLSALRREVELRLG